MDRKLDTLSYLLGAATGVMVMGGVWCVVEIYRDVYMRLSAIEGFLRALQIAMQQ